MSEDIEERQADHTLNRDYILDQQIGYLLRKAYQRNSLIFNDLIPDLTTTQFAVMCRLGDVGPMSQNLLGRSVAIDGATAKGVVDRLVSRGLLRTDPDPDDRRRYVVSLTGSGEELLRASLAPAAEVSRTMLSVLRPAERRAFLKMLERMT